MGVATRGQGLGVGAARGGAAADPGVVDQLALEVRTLSGSLLLERSTDPLKTTCADVLAELAKILELHPSTVDLIFKNSMLPHSGVCLSDAGLKSDPGAVVSLTSVQRKSSPFGTWLASCETQVTFPFSGISVPFGVEVMPDGMHALVADRGGTNVAMIDLRTKAVRSRFFGFHGPCGVAVSPDGSFALVANQQDNDIGRIDLKTGAVTFPVLIEEFDMHHGIAISPDGTYALVANSGANCVGRIDLRTWEVTFPYTGFRLPIDVAISPDGSLALVTNKTHNNIARIDLRSGKTTYPYQGFNEPAGVTFAPDGSYALVGNQSGHNIGRIDMRSGEVCFPFSGFNHPHGVAISPCGAYALVGNHGGNNVGCISLDWV